jgi:putative ABC transport system permease protein
MRFYRLLLHLYPASFRNEYGGEMAAVFGERLRDAGGSMARAAVMAGAIPDVLLNALAVHGDILRQDLRYSVRALRRSRGFAFTAVAVIALGVGANTAAFSVTDFVLLRPLPFPAPERLVTVWERTEGYARLELSPATYRDWKQAATVFDRVGAYTTTSANMLGSGEPVRLEGAQVTGDLFPTLGVGAAIGRTYDAADDFRVLPNGPDGADPVVVLSDSVWHGLLGGDSAVLGTTIRLNDRAYTVIGVMPPSFAFPTRRTQFWVPYAVSPDNYADRGNNYLYGVARLKPGVSLGAARSDLDLAAARSRAQFPSDYDGVGAAVARLRDDISSQSRTLVLALNGAAACVLLIVCANLANLLVARAMGRRLELAVRTAMGAGRERLARQLATEALVVAVAGGAAGVALAAAIVPLMWRLVPASLPTDAVPGIDMRVLLFAGALTFLTAIAFGLAPALRTGRPAVLAALRDGARSMGGRGERLRTTLAVAEIVASVVLLVAAGLLMRALWNVRATNPGFEPTGVLTLRTVLPMPRYTATGTRVTFYTRVLGEARALPGVSGAAYISYLPMVMRGGIWAVGLPGRPNERRDAATASMRFVTPGFFAALHVPLRRGRDVAETDTTQSQLVAVVSESFVSRFLPGDTGIGRTFRFAFADRTIVGVVGDIRVRGLERSSEPQVYLPYRQQRDDSFVGYMPKDLVVAAAVPVTSLAPALRAIVRGADPLQPVTDVRPLAEIVDAETASREAQIRVLSGFALAAFLLAAIGIHGVLAFSVSQRTPEIGVRMALGARRGDILAMMASHAVRLTVAGLVPGIALAYVAGRALESILAGVAPHDAVTFAAVGGLTIVMAGAGLLLPAIRAVRIDPLRAMRGE